MKKSMFCIMTAVLAACLLEGCKKDNGSAEPGAPEISVSRPKTYPSEKNTYTLSYTIVNPCEGVQLETYSEDEWIMDLFVDNKNIEFTIEENDSDEVREGTIELTYKGAEPVILAIRQKGRDKPENLDKDGNANCYIVSRPGDYMFKAVKGNGNESVGAVASVEVLWETSGTDKAPKKGALISSAEQSDDIISFNVPKPMQKGNALIAAKDASGKILWSWHIWLTDKPEDQVYLNGAGTVMDRNLGATSATPGEVGALGLMYQWGRKDPFLGASSIGGSSQAESTLEWPEPAESSESTGTVEYATEHPTTFIAEGANDNWHYSGDDALWQSPKTIYDPCPPGYMVPDGGDDGLWSKAFGSSSVSFKGEYDETNRGMDFGSWSANRNMTESKVCWYPSAGYLEDGSLYVVGNSGHYWSRSIHGSDVIAFNIYNSGSVRNNITPERGNGNSVRCVRE